MECKKKMFGMQKRKFWNAKFWNAKEKILEYNNFLKKEYKRALKQVNHSS